MGSAHVSDLGRALQTLPSLHDPSLPHGVRVSAPGGILEPPTDTEQRPGRAQGLPKGMLLSRDRAELSLEVSGLPTQGSLLPTCSQALTTGEAASYLKVTFTQLLSLEDVVGCPSRERGASGPAEGLLLAKLDTRICILSSR